MDEAPSRRITVEPNGPLRVDGGLPLSRQMIGTNAQGEAWRWLETERIDAGPSYDLCRCARSGTQPFCDDACTATGWDGTETATDAPYDEQAEIFPGPALDLADAVAFCASARFCDARGSAWTLVRVGDGRAQQLVEREVAHCPSGRLVARRLAEDGASVAVEPELEPSLVLVDDAPRGLSGPIWVRGGVEVVSGDGHAYEARNRVTLCRCGASRNKPFCDGSHVRIRFREGL